MRQAPLLATCLATAAFGVSAAGIEQHVDRVVPAITEIRHEIHRNPELANREHETAALVASHLRELGLEVTTGIAHTGVVGILEGARPGPVVAVRADMDALPVTERSGLPFASEKTTTYLGKEVGVAHACGHDIHTSVGLGVASVLASMREELAGTVKFIFQPAEEGAPPDERGGAELMVEEGVLEDPAPEAIFALHSFPDWEVGTVAVTSGPIMASSDHFRIEIRGKQSHGAYPHQSADPVVMAAQAVTALQGIRSRNIDPRAPAVLSVGIIEGGQRFNIIPETVRLEGTVRAFDTAVQDLVERRMHEILDGITLAGGGGYTLSYERSVPSTHNDPRLSQWAIERLERALGADNVVPADATMGAEDFSYFSREIPGFYFRLGVVAPGTESGGLHTPTFRADDGAIPVGIRALASLVADYLAAGGPETGD